MQRTSKYNVVSSKIVSIPKTPYKSKHTENNFILPGINRKKRGKKIHFL